MLSVIDAGAFSSRERLADGGRTEPRVTPRRSLTALLCITALAALSVVTATSAAASTADSDRPLRYVALGDSFAAAPLVRPTDRSSPRCLRSLANYPHVAAADVGAELTDVSCSGATAEHLESSQFPRVGPQFDVLTPDTDLVTMTLGGNDIDITSEVLGCVRLVPLASRCAQNGDAEAQERIDAFAPVLDSALAGIESRAPQARIVVVGGGSYIRPGGCFPELPLHPDDADHVQGVIDNLADTVERVTERRGHTFLDTTPVTTGHDMCAPRSQRFIENLIPTDPAVPFHLNAAGSLAVGQELASVIGS